ncbi:AraC family transcriptional regulator [Calothrix sp. NIES-4071]|nr:AraC family transcriptional regulator [Calothrix sp. NIES-4071]BAZ56667.1 AraC family transcriptional regulator [Calothrix sp. NIES-4105]
MTNHEPPQHLHLLDSFDLGWNGLNLIYEIEPADETPEIKLGMDFICIALDNFSASFMMDARWQHRAYAKGDIIIIPSTQVFPRTQLDRETPLLELFLNPNVLRRTAIDFDSFENIELTRQLQVNDPLIEQMGLAMMAEVKVGGASSKLYVESMTSALSAHLLRRYCSQRSVIKEYTGGLAKYKLRQVIEYINTHLEDNLTLSELAGAACTSPTYFASLFKQSMGITPHQYVMQCRIEKAKVLLKDSQLTLVEVCQLVGFQNQSHFTRVFKQYTKLTPKVYRDSF